MSPQLLADSIIRRAATDAMDRIRRLESTSLTRRHYTHEEVKAIRKQLYQRQLETLNQLMGLLDG